ncbi:MAG: hypothetical protein ACREB9_03230 [Thermoplasmata archaeon]
MESTESRLQIARLPEPRPLQKDVFVRDVVGSQSPARSVRGLEVSDLEFSGTEEVSIRRPCGIGRRDISYVLSGSGSVDGLSVSSGEGVLTEDVPTVEVRGSAGFRVVTATVPGTLR